MTPNRMTAVRFNRFFPAIIQPATAVYRASEEFARAGAEGSTNVAVVAGAGLQLRSYDMDETSLWDYEPAQAGFHRPGGLLSVHASGLNSEAAWRTLTLPGITYKPDTAGEGMYLWNKYVAATSGFDARLADDEAAFPPPFPGDDLMDVDRLWRSVADHMPWERASFIVVASGAVADLPGCLARVYFTGPAGYDDRGVGLGQYSVKLYIDGRGVLFERCLGASPGGAKRWVRRFEFRFTPLGGVGRFLIFSIASNATAAQNGDRITFSIAQSPALVNAGAFVFNLSGAISQAGLRKEPIVFRVPRSSTSVGVTVPAPFRIDMRRDVLASFNVYRSVYPESGTFIDDWVSLAAHPLGPVRTLTLTWFGFRPAGTAVTCRLRRSDGTLLAQVGLINGAYGQQLLFTCPAGPIREYRAEFDLSSSDDRFQTPTVTGYELTTPATIETPYVPNARQVVIRNLNSVRTDGAGTPRLEGRYITRVQASGASRNPEEASFEVAIENPSGMDLPLQWRAGTPVDIELQSREAPHTTLSIMARGYTMPVSVSRKGKKRTAGEMSPRRRWPFPDWNEMRIQGGGEYVRLKRCLTPARLIYTDHVTETNWKVTDAIRDYLTSIAGYPSTMVEIPDLPIRFWGGRGEDIVVEPGQEGLSLLQGWAEDYLGAALIFDENAGPAGMWRLLRRRRAPYNPVCRIYRDHPGAKMLPHLLSSYPIETRENGQIVAPTFAVDEEITFEPPEANLVQVFGSREEVQYSQVYANVASFNYCGLASGHAKYPSIDHPDCLMECVPVQVWDYTLQSQEAVDWVGRRVFEDVCFSREVIRFRAPLRFILDVLDPHQRLPRMPRVNDAVEYQQPDGTFATYLVSSCGPEYTHDDLMWGRWEIVRSTNLDVVGMPIGSFDVFELNRARIRQARASLDMPKRRAPAQRANRRFVLARGDMITLPSLPATTRQILDPDDPNFGRFRHMVDYDPAP
jgi:hypothetical protein